MQSFHTLLDDQDILEVSGEDSEKFLQGQLTCDLHKLAADGWCLGAACNNKGRVFSSFRLFRHAGGFYLILPPAMLDILRQALQKYIPFYKADMADAGDAWHRIGLAGAGAESLLADLFGDLPAPDAVARADNRLLINLSANEPRYELWLKAGTGDEVSPRLDGLEQRPLSHWQALDVEAGICMLHPAEVALYTPEELNMDLAGFVSFQKGCYTGQEIVARMHYRGKAGKRLYLVRGETALEPASGQLFSSSGETLEKSFNLLKVNNNISGFVVLKNHNTPQEACWHTMDNQEIPAAIVPLDYPQVSVDD